MLLGRPVVDTDWRAGGESRGEQTTGPKETREFGDSATKDWNRFSRIRPNSSEKASDRRFPNCENSLDPVYLFMVS